ncbi:UNVERIFIED_CONTAM: hypothetical protein Sradi_3666900 [Sesamum radiatum]|uniref:Uncharacterized protein n=1 Tax=Sesamum radiatum TaxID=300843 RepID=A0AAW2QIX8_SESRA
MTPKRAGDNSLDEVLEKVLRRGRRCYVEGGSATRSADLGSGDTSAKGAETDAPPSGLGCPCKKLEEPGYCHVFPQPFVCSQRC